MSYCPSVFPGGTGENHKKPELGYPVFWLRVEPKLLEILPSYLIGELGKPLKIPVKTARVSMEIYAEHLSNRSVVLYRCANLVIWLLFK